MSFLCAMDYKFWKLLFHVIVFSVITQTSNGDSNEDLKKLAAANNNLGLNLYRLLAKETPGNVFFSPFSLSSALGMLFAGAKEDTAQQLRSVLGYNKANLESSNVPSAFDQYSNLIIPKNQSPNPEYVLNLANELLLAKDFNVHPKYRKQVQDLFHAYIKEVDFEKNSAQIIDEVNSWVNQQTHGKISRLLSDLSPSTVLLILNAIYFKGTWKIQFDERHTRNGNFHNHGSNSKEVPLMHLTTKLPYLSSYEDLVAVELPYKGDNVSMIALKPWFNKLDSLAKLENDITPEKLLHIRNFMFRIEVDVTFPKFKIDYERSMDSDFKALGATDIFNPASANFSGITPEEDLYVSQVIHKAAIEVNEEGSEAAAATAVAGPIQLMPAQSPPRGSFTADRPFMFAIVDNRNDMILFLGRVNEL